MNRLNDTFAKLKLAQQKALIPYFCAGDPDVSQSALVMHEAVRAGAHIIELGIPFSDPAADGLTIQQAHERALAKGVGLRDVLSVVKTFRQQNQHTPVILMGYLNSLERMGADKALSAMQEAGVDGTIIVDMPLEALPDYQALFEQHQIAPIMLIAPTTNLQRRQKILEVARGFVYFISLKGVTGEQQANADAIHQELNQVREQSALPVCVGFGIKDGQSAFAMSQYADGVVIGSAFVAHLHQAATQGKSLPQSAFQFIHSISQTLNP
ncbi:MAG: tryptophan synthase subunit alpha [Cardiobacteriaceae bacterium]|nr:tryptophan synthase subunit alpha [Cardiobacteriaceae bacterium]